MLVRYGAPLPLSYGSRSTGGWLGPRVSTDAVEKGIEPHVLGHLRDVVIVPTDLFPFMGP